MAGNYNHTYIICVVPCSVGGMAKYGVQPIMVELGILAFIIYSVGIMVWALSDMPRWVREKKKRGKRTDYKRW